MSVRDILQTLLPETPFRLIDINNHVIDTKNGENAIERQNQFDYLMICNVLGICATDYMVIIYTDYEGD